MRTLEGRVPGPRGSGTDRRGETERLLALARSTTGDERSRLENDVVGLNLPVAHDIARRYRNRGIAADDLDQVACLGLVKAARAYEPARGTDFLSFAVPTIRGELRRHFRDAGWVVRPPRPVQEVQARVTAAESALTQRLGRSPSTAEIAAYLEVPRALVLEALRASGLFSPISLDGAREHVLDDAPLASLGYDDPAFDRADARLSVRPLMRCLSHRERRILELRYFAERTQSQIGAELGVSQEQVSRLLSQILTRLRGTLEEDAA